MQKMTNNTYMLMAVAMGGVFLIVFLMILLQARTQNSLLRQKKVAAEREAQHHRELARILIISQENERKRIGMDLHDEVGTVLSALRIHLEKMEEAGTHELAALNATGKKTIDNIIYNVRKISHNLSPFMKGAYELKDGIEDLTDHVAASGKLVMSVDFNSIEEFGFLPEDTQLALYRILSELMNNTLRHAKASAVHVSFVKTVGLLTISYTDNGKGMTPTDGAKKGIGLSNIESRCNAMGATFELEQNTGKGFGLIVKIPIA